MTALISKNTPLSRLPYSALGTDAPAGTKLTNQLLNKWILTYLSYQANVTKSVLLLVLMGLEIRQKYLNASQKYALVTCNLKIFPPPFCRHSASFQMLLKINPRLLCLAIFKVVTENLFMKNKIILINRTTIRMLVTDKMITFLWHKLMMVTISQINKRFKSQILLLGTQQFLNLKKNMMQCLMKIQKIIWYNSLKHLPISIKGIIKMMKPTIKKLIIIPFNKSNNYLRTFQSMKIFRLISNWNRMISFNSMSRKSKTMNPQILRLLIKSNKKMQNMLIKNVAKLCTKMGVKSLLKAMNKLKTLRSLIKKKLFKTIKTYKKKIHLLIHLMMQQLLQQTQL